MSLYIYPKPIECTTPRVNPNAHRGLWVIMMCRGSLQIAMNVPLVGDVDSEEGCAHMGTGSIFELSILSAQFYCEPKALKKMKFIKNNFFKPKENKTLGHPFYLSSSVILVVPVT